MCAPTEMYPDGYNVSAPANLTYSSFACSDNNYEVLCEGLSHCDWNYAESTCQRKPCAGMLTPGNCTAIPGCVYDTQLFYCMDVGGAIPCSRLWLDTRCQAESDRCIWNITRSQCLDVAVPESSLACSEFISASKCPLDRCQFDPYANACIGVDEVPSCAAYRTSAVCPSAGTEYEDVSSGTPMPPATAMCARVSSACDTTDDVYQIAHTATSDRVCQAVSGVNACAVMINKMDYIVQQYLFLHCANQCF